MLTLAITVMTVISPGDLRQSIPDCVPHNEVSILEAVFKGYTQDRITRRKFQIGDRTAQADVTAPEVVSTSPEANDTGVNKAKGT